jgi:hypothetical protein
MKIQLSIISLILLVNNAISNTFASDNVSEYLRDKGTGIATSMFGTYVRQKEILIYPFYEFYYDHNAEYDPSEMEFGPEADYYAKSIAHEGLIYLAYGITDWLMVEFEMAGITAKQWRSKKDTTSTMPDPYDESGLGDVEGQIRWRYNREKEKVPEFFNYFEVVFPLQPDRKLIGTSAWEFKLGLGITKGFKFGTLTGRFAVEYDGADEKVETGEYALEYLRKISDHFKLFGMFEGSQDELELIVEGQIHVNKNVYFKIGSGFGITPKATDIAPEVGVMFSYRFGGED